jgi:hypothetical protein
MPTRVASTLLPSAPTRVIAAGARRNTCAAVTTSPGCQTTAVPRVPRRPRTAKVLAPTRSTSAAIASECAASAGSEGAGDGPAAVELFMDGLGASGRWPNRTRLPAATYPPNGGQAAQLGRKRHGCKPAAAVPRDPARGAG